MISLIYAMGIIGSLGLIVAVYAWLWKGLIKLTIIEHYNKEMLLFKISLLLSTAFMGIILTFSIILMFFTAVDTPNYIMHQKTGAPVNWYEFNTFMYFSAVTYFSLGYGDYVPVGTIMQIIVLIESLLGYINSGLLIAYGFDLFRRYYR